MVKRLFWYIFCLGLLVILATGGVYAAGGTALPVLLIPASIHGENGTLQNEGALVDGDTSTQTVLLKGQTAKVEFEFSGTAGFEVIKVYLPEKSKNTYNLEYLTSSGIWMSLPGMNNLTGEQLQQGWNRFQVNVPGEVKRLRFRVDRADAKSALGISEVEFWGRTMASVSGSQNCQAEEDIALEWDAKAYGGKRNLHINVNAPLPAIQSAELVYDVYNLESFKDATWEINGTGEHSLTPRGVSNEWVTLVEAIDPNLLVQGRNTVSFELGNSKKNGLKVKNVLLKLHFRTGEQKITRVEGVGCKDELLPNLFDGDLRTRWESDWQVHDQISLTIYLAEKTDLEYLTWLQGKSFLDGVRVEYLTPQGWQLLGHELKASELVEGWNVLQADRGVETDQLRITLLNPLGKQMIGPLYEMRIFGSAGTSNQVKSNMIISYPANNEIVADSFPIKAFLRENYDKITVNGEPVKPNNKYLEKQLRVDELTGQDANRMVTIEAYQDGNVVSATTLTVLTLSPPALSVTSPVDGYLTNASRVSVTGQTDVATNTIAINGKVFTSGSTSFALSYPLDEGLNKLVITASNSMGSMSTEKTIYVNRDTHPPVIHFDEDYAKPILYQGQTSRRITGYVEEYSTCKLYVNGVEQPLQYGAFDYTASIAQGNYNLQFRAVDQLNQESSTQLCLSADATAPNAFTPVVPTSWVTTSSASVSFSATDLESGINHFEVKQDGGSYITAQSPYLLSGLTDGIHTVYVKAVNNVGLSTVGSAQLRVDSKGPQGFTPILNPQGWSQTRTPQISFATTDEVSGVNHYEIKIDNGTFTTVTSPYTLPSLVDGSHTVTIKAFDNAGLSVNATVQALVDNVAPMVFTPVVQSLVQLAGQLTGSTNNNEPVLTFATTDTLSGIARYEVQVDTGSFLTATSPYTLPLLSDGTHRITVMAVDRAGLSTTGTVQLAVDTQAPVVPANFDVVSDAGQITVKWSAGGEADLAKYRLYRAPAWTDGTNMKEFPAPVTIQYVDTDVVESNAYTYYVMALDRLGNISGATTSVTKKAGVTQMLVTPDLGGEVTYGDQVIMSIPVGAMQDAATIQISTATKGELPAPTNKVVSNIYKFDLIKQTSTTADTTGDSGGFIGTPEENVTFDVELTVKMAYDKNLIPAGYTDNDLDVYYFSEADGLWVRMPKKFLDPDKSQITFTTTHFSNYEVQVTENYSPSAAEYKDLGLAPYGNYFQNNQEFVSPSSGALTIVANDVNLPGRNGFDLSIERIYSSAQAEWDKEMEQIKSKCATFGPGWRLGIPRIEDNFEGQFLYLEDGTAIQLKWLPGQAGDGTRQYKFDHQEGVYFTVYKTQEKGLIFWNCTGYEVYFKDGTKYEFDQDGKIKTKIDRTGKNIITFTYNDDKLSQITDTLSRTVNFNYGSTSATSKRLESISVSGGPSVTYAYDANGNLISATSCGKETTTYEYKTYQYKTGYEITYPGTRINEDGAVERYTVRRDNSKSTSVPVIIKITYPMKGTGNYDYNEGMYETSATTVLRSGTDWSDESNQIAATRKDYIGDLRVKSQCQYTSAASTVAINPLSYIYVNTRAYVENVERWYVSQATITGKYKRTEMDFDKDGLNTEKRIFDLTDIRLLDPTSPSNRIWSLKEKYAYNSKKEMVNKNVYHSGKSEASYTEQFDYDNWGNMKWHYSSANKANYYYYYLNTDCTPIGDSRFLQFTQTQPTVSEHIHNLLLDEFVLNQDEVNNTLTPEQTHYQYDNYGNVLLKARRHGNTWITTGYQYDSNGYGNVVKVTDANSGVSDLTYDTNNAYVIKNSRNALITADGSTPETAVTQTGYDTIWGVKNWETDPLGAKTEYKYDDPLHRLTAVIYPDDTPGMADNLVKLQIYDDVNNITTVANMVLGTAKTIEEAKQDILAIENLFDPAKGRLIPDTVGDYTIFNVTRYVYDGLNRLKEIRQYLKKNELKVVDGKQQVSPFVTKFDYDEVGNRTMEFDAEGLITTKKYDGLNRLTDIYYPTANPNDSNHLHIDYALDSNTRTVTDAENHQTVEMKDWNDRVIEVRKYDQDEKTGLVATYSSKAAYDTLGNQVEVIDGKQQHFRFIYDDWNQAIENVLPETDVIIPGATQSVKITPRIKYEYDNLGRKTAEIAPNGIATGNTTVYRTEYAYDALDRQIQTKVYRATGTPLVTKTVYGNATNTYSIASRSIKVIDPKNQTTQKVYNPQGWVIAEFDAAGSMAYHQYSQLGKEISLTNPRGVALTTSTGWKAVSINGIQYYLDPAYTTKQVYNSLSRLTQTWDLEGNKLDITYNKVGAKREEKLTAGNDSSQVRVTSYEYTPQYWLKSVTQGTGSLTYRVDYEYDKVGNKTKEIYPSIVLSNGTSPARIYQYKYDALGRLTRVIKPETVDGQLNQETYGYDAIGNRTSVTNGRNYTTSYEYNGMGKLAKVVEPGNVTTQYYYDPNGNLVRKNSANNLNTEYTYNELNLMTAEVRTRAQDVMNVNYAYDELGRVTASSDPRGVITAFRYYSTGNVAEENSYVPLAPGPSANLQQVTVSAVPAGYSAEGHASYYYDKLGNLTNVTDVSGSLDMVYDKLNRVTSETRQIDGITYKTGYSYDFAGNLKSIQYPGSSTDAEKVTYTYDGLNRLISVRGFADTLQNDLLQKNFMYDAAGNLVKMTYNDNSVTTIVPDIMSRPQRISVQVPESNTTTRVALNLVYAYDANGNVTSRNSNTYLYDELDRLSTAEIDGTIFVNTPAKVGYTQNDYFTNNEIDYQCQNVELHFDYAANTLGLQFDAPRKVARVELSTTGIANHRITAKGLRIFVQSSANGSFTEVAAKDWSFSKDAKTGQIALIFKTDVTAYTLKIHANYDNRDISTESIKDESTFVNYVRNMAKVYAKSERTRIHYDYDAVGNRNAETVTDVNSNYSVKYTYSYYGNSDRLRTRESQTVTNMKTQGGYIDGTLSYGPSEQKAYNYDKAGNLIEKGNSYTLSGNYTQILPTGSGVEYWKYGYDAQNQLTTVWKNGTDNASIIARIAYDYAGKHTKTVEGNTVTHYVYGYGGQLLYEVHYTTTASDPLKATGAQLQGGKATSYIYAMGHQLAKVEGSITGGTKYYYHNDNLGSTMLMTKYVDVSKVQSSDLNKPNPIVFLQDYTPFGQNLHQPGEPAATNETNATLKFTGQIEDADIGLCYYNARYYDPEIGRFTQEDSYKGEAENSESQNCYIYVLNNPLRYIDTTGHKAEESTVVIITFGDGSLLTFSAKNRDTKQFTGVLNAYKNAANAGMKVVQYEATIDYPNAVQRLISDLSFGLFKTWNEPSDIKLVANSGYKSQEKARLGKNFEDEKSALLNVLECGLNVRGISDTGLISKGASLVFNSTASKITSTILNICDIIRTGKSIDNTIRTKMTDKTPFYYLDAVFLLNPTTAGEFFGAYENVFGYGKISKSSLNDAATNMMYTARQMDLVTEVDMSVLNRLAREAGKTVLNLGIDIVNLAITISGL